MPGAFVTATGTAVGKTYVTAGLIRAARRAGLAVDAFKPVLSGFTPGDLDESDAGQLLRALGRPVTAEAVAAIAPWRYAAPLAPAMAAAAEGRDLPFEAVVAACRARMRPGVLGLIEGVGGVMVPLDARRTVLDLIVALPIPAILVSPTGLGAISHVLTAVAALRARNLVPHAVILNETAGSGVALEATARTVAGFCEGSPVHVLGRHATEAAFDALLARLAEGL